MSVDDDEKYGFFDGRWTAKDAAAQRPDMATRLDKIEAWAAGQQPSSGETPAAAAYTAGETISALRAVCVAAPGVVMTASPTTIRGRLPLGISMHAAVSGATIAVQDQGALYNEGWNWTPGHAVLLGPAGQLVQQQPAGQLWLVTLGFALTAQSMLVRISEPLQTAQ